MCGDIKTEKEELINNDMENLHKSIYNNEFLFELNVQDDIDSIDYNNKNNIKESDIASIPIDQINVYKRIVNMVKLIKTFPLNYDYIIEKEINDIKRIPDN